MFGILFDVSTRVGHVRELFIYSVVVTFICWL